MTLHLPRSMAAAACGLLVTLAAAPPAIADSTRNRQWHLDMLDITAAHRISQGDGVTVAVIDTGVAASHPDLRGNVLAGFDLTGDKTRGQKDSDGHGTAMAGLIAAHGHGRNRASGALGIAPRAKILPIRTKTGQVGNSNDLPGAIDRAVQHGAKVISMSLGAGADDRLQQAVENALDADVVVVASNGNRPGQFFIQYPAKYPGVVAVAATDRDGNIASVSVKGSETVISAPGVEIASTSQTGAYQFATGTSDATAIVAGAAALVRSRYPKLSASEVVHRLTATATDKGAPGRDDQYGFGSLNLMAALTAKVPPAVPDTSPTAATPAPSESTTAPVTAGDDVSLKPNGAFFIVIGVLLLGVLAGVGAVVWLIVRSRRRQVSPTRSTTFR